MNDFINAFGLADAVKYHASSVASHLQNCSFSRHSTKMYMEVLAEHRHQKGWCVQIQVPPKLLVSINVSTGIHPLPFSFTLELQLDTILKSPFSK